MARSFALAQVVRDTIAAYYDDASNGLVGTDQALPAKRFITYGLPPADCEALVVSLDSRIAIEGNANASVTPTDRDEVAFYMRATVLSIWVFRCAPGLDDQGNTPTVEEEEAAAELLANDLERFELCLYEALENGELAGCGGVAWIASEFVTPEGLIGAAVLRLQLSEE